MPPLRRANGGGSLNLYGTGRLVPEFSHILETMDIARSSIKLFVVNGGNAIITFLGVMFFAQRLGASALGTYFLFEALLIMLSIPTDLGIRFAVEKRISQGQEPDDVLSTALVLKLVPLVIISSLILSVRGVINSYLGASIAVFLPVALILHEFGQLMVFVIRGELRVGESAVLHLAQKMVWVMVGGFLVLQGFGVRGVVFGLIIGLAAKLLWGNHRRLTSLGRPSMDYASSLYNYSKYAFISFVGGYFYQWVDIAIIGLFLTQVHVGAYEVAWRVTLVVMLFSKAIATSIFPQVSEWHANDQTSSIEMLIPNAMIGSLIFVIPAFFGTMLFSRDILTLLFGQEFSIAWLVAIILMGEKIFQAPYLIFARAIQGIDRPELSAKAGVIAMVLNVGFNVVLVWQFGIIGAAIGTMVSVIVNSLLHGYYLSKFISVNIPYVRIGEIITASLGMVAILFAVQTHVSVTTLPMLGFVIMLGMMLYGGFILVFPNLRAMVLKNLAAHHPF